MAIVLACANLVSFVTRLLSDVINDEQSNNDQSSQHNDKDSERSYARSNLSLVSWKHVLRYKINEKNVQYVNWGFYLIASRISKNGSF